MPYRAVFFDLDDTLYDDSGSWRTSAAATAALAAQVLPGLDATAVTDFFLDHSDVYWRAMDPTRETRPILAIRTAHWLATLDAFGHADRALARELAHDYGRRRAQGIALFPDALPLLDALRAAGKTLVLITSPSGTEAPGFIHGEEVPPCLSAGKIFSRSRFNACLFGYNISVHFSVNALFKGTPLAEITVLNIDKSTYAVAVPHAVAQRKMLRRFSVF